MKFWLFVPKIDESENKKLIWHPEPKIQQTKMLVTCQRFGGLFLFGLIWQYSSNHKTFNRGRLLILCSKMKILWVKSRDFSQAEKDITTCKAKQIHKMTPIFTQNNNLSENSCHFCEFAQFSKQSFARLKSKHLAQFFWWKVNLRELRGFILQKVQASVVERQKKKFYYPSFKKTPK